MHLDGNAVAGTFGDLLGFEVTTATLTCAGCAQETIFAETHVYHRGPGVVVRCPSCQGPLMRMVRLPNDTIVDFTGARSWRIPGR
ncbi:DUF6510 family protein [Mycobacterium sp. AT1]|uniref:DUF6510 family protein n=1 Tax=Mycobacterium sp. AT1 TaxID=1961706 RepID=UPI0009AD33D9|nr:DUF6510 family protein [Mycobacterium sp. AT1]OPX06831.1 hypothetical protein B1790_25865 [Mycobacterium sp. AT1]